MSQFVASAQNVANPVGLVPGHGEQTGQASQSLGGSNKAGGAEQCSSNKLHPERPASDAIQGIGLAVLGSVLDVFTEASGGEPVHGNLNVVISSANEELFSAVARIASS